MGRIKGSTLVETITAAIIIIVLFMGASVVLLNVSKTSVKESQIRAKMLVEQYAELLNVNENADFNKDVVTDSELHVTSAIISVLNKHAVKYLFTVSNKNGEIIEKQERILLIK